MSRSNAKNPFFEFLDKNRISLIIALIHWIITFFTDKFIFTVSPIAEPLNYYPCKILLFILLFVIWRAVIRHTPETMSILKYAAIYFVPIIAVLIFKLPEGFLSNDETLIFQEASNLASYTWFYYITTWYYIISMMLIPAWFGPILVKVAIQLLVCGYVVHRLSKYLSAKYGMIQYLAFMIPPVLAYTTSAHRIPVYFLLYLFLLFTLLMDKLEEKSITRAKLLWILFLGAVLTQWRTEGIYFAVILPILLFLTYPDLRNKKSAITLLVSALIIQYIVAIPQNGILPNRMNDKANNRMGPFYAYTITNMMRNGLDREKNKDDLEKVAHYLNLDTIDAINNDLGNINYEDVLILYYPGYTGKIETATTEDYELYTEGCRNIFINNPDVLLRTRIGAFDYAATPYDIKWEQGGIKGFALFIVSIVKTIAYNLYIPHIILALLCLYSLIRRRWFTFFMTGGLIGHFIIVFILAPASYFKYYFPIYFTMYFWLILIFISLLWNRFNPDKKFSFIQ